MNQKPVDILNFIYLRTREVKLSYQEHLDLETAYRYLCDVLAEKQLGEVFKETSIQKSVIE